MFFALLILLAEQTSFKQPEEVDYPKFEKSKLTANSTIVDLANMYFEILKPSDKTCRQTEAGNCDFEQSEHIINEADRVLMEANFEKVQKIIQNENVPKIPNFAICCQTKILIPLIAGCYMGSENLHGSSSSLSTVADMADQIWERLKHERDFCDQTWVDCNDYETTCMMHNTLVLILHKAREFWMNKTIEKCVDRIMMCDIYKVNPEDYDFFYY